jgi:hypothetical protein
VSYFEITFFPKTSANHTTSNGGNFEFLPVTIQSAGVVLTALLRVGVQAGLDVSTPTETISGERLSLSAGVVVGVWADVAQFTTNVTAAPEGSICELRVIEEYSILLGANVGATLAIDGQAWGPTPNTQVPIFYTTLADACAVSGNTTAAASAAATAATLNARADLTTTTLSTKITYTATMCQSTGLVNCPVSLQTTTKNSVTKTLVTSVPSGSDATFPATTQASVLSTIAFGTRKQELASTSGSPVSYVPPASTTSSGPSGISSVIKGKTGRVSNKIIIGVSVGVGVPVFIAIVAGCM